jgi:hypothetical protein
MGGDMARLRIQNLALPIFDFATLSTLITMVPKLAKPWDNFQTLPQWNCLFWQRWNITNPLGDVLTLPIFLTVPPR